jgi:hypothetical protein
VAFLGAAPAALAADDAKASFRLGGGFLYNNKIARGGKTMGGGHIALDIHVPGKQVSFSPYVEGYRKSKWSSAAGLNFLIRPKTSGDKGSAYLGVGGGVFHVPGTYKGSFNILVGADIKASDKVSIFIEPRYAWAASSTLNGVAVHAGIAIHVK